MKIVRTEKRLCPCCMEEHEVKTIVVREHNIFKGIEIDYDAEYFYCDQADETYAEENQISANDIAMKNAYRLTMGLLTSGQIADIRTRYGISQSDLCLLLGWGAKTITRYESHQVQDIAHDTILRKLSSDPEWFLSLLRASESALSPASYAKYLEAGTALFEADHDRYLKSAIMSRYVRFLRNPEFSGNTALSLDKVVDMIHYYADSSYVTSLYLVKLLKMLWYADALSYKRRGQAISGLVYRALPMGAAPVAYESIINLSAIHFEEVDMGDGTGYRFLPTGRKTYPHLTKDDTDILDAVIKRFGRKPKDDIVNMMHKEDAYTETAPKDIIQFKYAMTLSLE